MAGVLMVIFGSMGILLELYGVFQYWNWSFLEERNFSGSWGLGATDFALQRDLQGTEFAAHIDLPTRHLTVSTIFVWIWSILVYPLILAFGITGVACANNPDRAKTVTIVGVFMMIIYSCILLMEFGLYGTLNFHGILAIFPFFWLLLPAFYIIGGLRNKVK
jgi:hypothetical protein